VVDALRPEFRGEVAFVLANLYTREGREFAARHLGREPSAYVGRVSGIA
jgi:hypothetical protein